MSRLVSEIPYFRNPDVAAVYWGRVCPVIAAALYQHDLRYEFCCPSSVTPVSAPTPDGTPTCIL